MSQIPSKTESGLPRRSARLARCEPVDVDQETKLTLADQLKEFCLQKEWHVEEEMLQLLLSLTRDSLKKALVHKNK